MCAPENERKGKRERGREASVRAPAGVPIKLRAVLSVMIGSAPYLKCNSQRQVCPYFLE